MKILHINTNDCGGAFKAAYRLYESQQELGLETYFLCLKKNCFRKNINYFNSKIDYSIFKKVLWKFGFPQTKEHRQIKINKSMLKIVEKYSIIDTDYSIEDCELFKNADIIHFHWINGFVDLTKLNYNGKKIIWTFHDLNPILGGAHYENDQKIVNKINKIGEEKVIFEKKKFFEKFNPTIVSPSNWLKDKIVSSGVIHDFSKIHVIPYGIDLNRFKPINDIKTTRRDLNLSIDKKVVLVIAESITNPRKGFHFVHELIRDFSTKVQFILIGKNTFNSSNVLNLGYIDDENKLIELYNLSDIVLMPSLEDNLPNVMIEALSCGTPVISFSNGGMKDHIGHETGILIEPLDYKSLAKEFNKFVYGHYNFDRGLIREYAKNNFDKRLQLEACLNLYKSI